MFNKVGIKKSRSKMAASTCFITSRKDMHGSAPQSAAAWEARAVGAAAQKHGHQLSTYERNVSK